MKNRTRSLIELHIAVFLFGFTALFGKFLHLPSIIIVFGRTFFATIVLALILLFTKQDFKLKSKKDYLFLISIGILFSIHWFTFFQSVQVSNVAIAVLTFSTYPVFVTFLEPYFFNEKIKIFDICTAITTLLGVSLVVPKFELSNNLTQGAIWGILAGLTGAALAILCKKGIEKFSNTKIPFYQNLTCAIVSLPFVIYLKPTVQIKDILLLLLLGVVFTALSGTLYIKSLTSIKVQLASIITCLEPVYAIIFAALLLKEIPTIKTLAGGLIILGTIFCATLRSKTQEVILKH